MSEQVSKEVASKGYNLAQGEKQKEKVEKVKGMVLATLSKIEKTKKLKREVEETLRILNLDLKDLKEGRLDRIEERQQIQPKAVLVSVVHVLKTVIQETEVVPDPYRQRWYYPWQVWVGDSLDVSGAVDYTAQGFSFMANNSFIKDNVGGTYKMEDGAVVSI